MMHSFIVRTIQYYHNDGDGPTWEMIIDDQGGEKKTIKLNESHPAYDQLVALHTACEYSNPDIRFDWLRGRQLDVLIYVRSTELVERTELVNNQEHIDDGINPHGSNQQERAINQILTMLAEHRLRSLFVQVELSGNYDMGDEVWHRVSCGNDYGGDVIVESDMTPKFKWGHYERLPYDEGVAKAAKMLSAAAAKEGTNHE